MDQCYNDKDLKNDFGNNWIQMILQRNLLPYSITRDFHIDQPIDRRRLYSKESKHNIVMAVKIRRKLADFDTKSRLLTSKIDENLKVENDAVAMGRHLVLWDTNFWRSRLRC